MSNLYDVLLMLSGNSLPHGQDSNAATSQLTAAMMEAGCRELHLLQVDISRTPSFPWPLLLEFRFPPDEDAQERQRTVDALRSAVLTWCPWLDSTSLKALRLRQTGIGEERDGSQLIVSLYSWQRDADPAERERCMWIHFDMEQEEPDYRAVHFNTLDDSEQLGDGDIDFVFQAYVDTPEGISRIYASPRLEKMRVHSRTFLDTGTRQLAFGTVRIVCAD